MTTPQQSPFHRTVNLGALNTPPTGVDPASGAVSPTGATTDASVKDYIAKLKVSILIDNLAKMAGSMI